jgi:hypothetical protein
MAGVMVAAGLVDLALAGVFYVLFSIMRRFDPGPGFCGASNPPCDLAPNYVLRQAFRIYEILVVPSVVWLVVTFGLALAGLMLLGIVQLRGPSAQ